MLVANIKIEKPLKHQRRLGLPIFLSFFLMHFFHKEDNSFFFLLNRVSFV